MKQIDYRKLNYYGTTVQVYKTQNEIRSILQKFNLQGIRFTEYQNLGVIEFILLKNGQELTFRFKYELPSNEKHKRQVYRCLYYYLKNRFLAIEFGITSVEKEFLQELVLKLPDGTDTTVKEALGNKIMNLTYNNLKFLGE